MKTNKASPSVFVILRLSAGFAFCVAGFLLFTGFDQVPIAPAQKSRVTQTPDAVNQVDALQSWAVVANYPATIESPAVASDGTYAYSAGGSSGGATNGVFRYDPAANTWTSLAALPTALYATRAVYAANTNAVYVFGGYNGSVLSTTYKYNIATNTWTTGAAMPSGRYFPNVAYDNVNGKIYVIGGFDSSFTEANQTWEYDPVANTWNTSRANIPMAMAGSGTSIVGQFIYLAGSWNAGAGSTTHYRYNVATDAWTLMSPLPVAIYEPATGIAGGQIYLIGGGNPSVADGQGELPGLRSHKSPSTSFASTYVYTIAGNSWAPGPATNVPHSFTGGTTIGNRLLVVGGFDGGADTNTVEMAAADRGHRILIAHADCNADPVTLANNLYALDPRTKVDFFDANTGTPTLAQMSAYDIVVPFSNCQYQDAATLGNNLASYLNAGGVVVAFNFDWSGGNYSPGGTWASGGYSPFNVPGSNNFTAGSLGTFTAGHPLMQGVTTLTSSFRATLALAAGATQVAAWNDATSLMAFKNHVVGLSGYIGDFSDNWTGDYARVILNAGNWMGASTLFASLNGQVSISNGGGSILQFNSAGSKSTFVSAQSRPRGLAFDSSGNLFVAITTLDTGTGFFQGTIAKTTPTGTQTTFASPSGNFFLEDLKMDNAGNVYAIGQNNDDPNLASTIFKFTPGGVQSTFGSLSGQAFGLAFDTAGNLFVASLADRSIYKFTPAGAQSVFVGPSAFGGGTTLQNTGFETGSFSPGWTVLSSNPAPAVSNLQFNSGTYSAHLGSTPPTATAGDSSIFQQVTIPSTGAVLTYAYWPRTSDTISFDWQDAYVTDASGSTVLATVMHVCVNTQDWTGVTYDMTPFAGQTVGIKFLVHGGNASNPTDMFVDDVILGVPGPAGLAFDRSGNLFVSTEGANGSAGGDRILQFTPGGAGSVFATGLHNPRGLAFDSAGNLFVAEVPVNAAGDILRFTPAGASTLFATALGRPLGNGGPEFLAFQPIAPVSAVSRKAHGPSGAFDIPLPLTGPVGVECRIGGATNDYQIIVNFAGPVTVGGSPEAQVTSGAAMIGTGGVTNGGIVSVSGSMVTIPLTNVANAQRINVTLFGVNDGSRSGNVVIPMGRLTGDTTGDGHVNASDVSQTKSRIGQTIGPANFRSDVNINGAINASDPAVVKANLGTALP